MSDAKQKTKILDDGHTGVLSTGPMGEVSLCPEGCLHIDTPAVSVRLTEPQFRALVEMLTTAAGKLRPRRGTAVH